MRHVLCILALALLAGACVSNQSIPNGNPNQECRSVPGAGGGIQFRFFDSGGLEIENMSQFSIRTEYNDGFICTDTTEPGETHANVRRNVSGFGPSTVRLLDSEGNRVARAQIARCENPRNQRRCTWGNVEATFFSEGFRYDYVPGLRRFPRCPNIVRHSRTGERLCAYDWVE